MRKPQKLKSMYVYISEFLALAMCIIVLPQCAKGKQCHMFSLKSPVVELTFVTSYTTLSY